MTKKLSKKIISYNKPQLRVAVNDNAKESTNVWGRGTGKSTGIAWRIVLIVRKMPRSSWAIVGSTYKQMLTRTLPATIAGLEQLGFFRDVHYVIGKRPPADWSLPYQAPLSYEHYITFYTGAGFHLVSLDGGGGSSRGLNIDGVITDETLLINKEKFDTDVLNTNRGNKRYFGKIPFHHGIFHYTSMPYPGQADWILKESEYYENESHDIVLNREMLIKLQLEFIDCKDRKQRLEMWPKLQKLSKSIKYYVSKRKKYYTEANCFDNLENLTLAYIEQQREQTLDYLFMIEMLNKRPIEVEGGFYALLDLNQHGYSDNAGTISLDQFEYKNEDLPSHYFLDGDCLPNVELNLAVDWGDRISCLTVSQHHPEAYKFINCFYVKHPKLVDDLADEFEEYYKCHKRKKVKFIIDNEYGNRSGPDSNLSYNEKFVMRLKKHGWEVEVINLGRIPAHHTRYLLAHEFFKESKPELFPLRFNLVKCKDLLIALQQTKTKQIKGKIHKDKSSEKKKNNQEHATHFTDAFDPHVVYLSTKISSGVFIDNLM